MKKAFTLIELLLVITILSVLAVSVFVALNPSKRLKDTKDARRATDVDSILTAIHQSIVDNKGTTPTNMPTAAGAGGVGLVFTMLGATGNTCNIATTYCGTPAAACTDLMSGAQNLSTYIASIPIDPNGSPTFTAAKTGYGISLDTNGIVTIKACATDGTTVISASR